MQFEDDDAIDVDEFLDQLTELLFVPVDSPVAEIQRAIPVGTRSPRPVLVILPEEGATLRSRATSPTSAAPKRAGARSVRLTAFAGRAGQRRAH